MDLKLTNYDIDITNGKLSFVTGIEAIAQSVVMKWRTWLGETAYDITAGVPYLQVIFKKNTNTDSIRYILEQKARSVPGVTSVYLNVRFNKQTRVLSLTGKITALNEEIDFSEVIQG